MKKLRIGDIVQVITGKDSGKSGELMSVITKTDKTTKITRTKVVVKGINIVKRARKANFKTIDNSFLFVQSM